MKAFGNQLNELLISELRLARKILHAEMKRETDPEKLNQMQKGIEEISDAINEWKVKQDSSSIKN